MTPRAWLLLILLALQLLALAYGCGTQPRTPAEAHYQVAYQQRVLLTLGTCAAAVATRSAADKAEAEGDTAGIIDWTALAVCAGAGWVGLFGLPGPLEPDVWPGMPPHVEVNGAPPVEPEPPELIEPAADPESPAWPYERMR